MPSQAVPSGPMCIPRAARISPSARATYWNQPGRPISSSAQSLVDRQRADRRGELERLVRNLGVAGRLQPSARRALALLLVLTSYETFRELREAGLSPRQAMATLQETARDLILT